MQNFFRTLLSILFIGTSIYADGIPIVSESASVVSDTVANAPVIGENSDSWLPFRLRGELLYLKPGIEQSSYVISSSLNAVGAEFFPNGRRYNNRATYKPAFRVEGLYDLCDENLIDFRFAYFNAGHSSSTTGAFLFDTIGYPGEGAQAPEDTSYNGTASIHDRYRYYGADLTLNRLSLCSCYDNLYLLFGLHYANIHHKMHSTSVGFSIDGSVTVPVDNSFSRHSHFWGIGPQIGLEYAYKIPQCWLSGSFALAANLRASLLASKSNASLHYDTIRTLGTAGVNLSNDSVWRVNPALDAKLGGSYTFCWCGYEGIIELGYEWLWYHNAVNSITGFDDAFPGDSLDFYSNLSLHGPYLKIGVDF